MDPNKPRSVIQRCQDIMEATRCKRDLLPIWHAASDLMAVIDRHQKVCIEQRVALLQIELLVPLVDEGTRRTNALSLGDQTQD